jgi:peptide/nickel transport system permease protein
MLWFTLRETARMLFALIGAALLAAGLASLDSAAAWHSFSGFLASFAHHASALGHLNFGVSATSGRPAIADLAERLPATLTVLGGGSAIALAIGGPLGILFGGGPGRRAAAPLIQFVAATPVFCAALLLDYLAVQFLHWPHNTQTNFLAPAGAFHLDLADPMPALQPLLLPALTVGAAGAAAVQLALRHGAALVAREPYRHGLRRLGLSALEIDRAYVVPQVLAVLVASLGELALALVAASAVAEWVFDIPGAAVLFVKSVALGDWTMAGLVLFAFAAIALVADFCGRVGAHAISDHGLAP